jgi:hypothetical protein
MRRLLASVLGLVLGAANADELLQTPAFSLELEGDWQPVQSSDGQQRSYYSKSRDVGLTTSYVLHNARPADTERIATKLKQFRLEGEGKAAEQFNLRMTIAEPLVASFSQGHQVAYYGHDSSGRQFRYLGLVFANKTVNLYAESKSRSQAELEATFNALLRGLKP